MCAANSTHRSILPAAKLTTPMLYVGVDSFHLQSKRSAINPRRLSAKLVTRMPSIITSIAERWIQIEMPKTYLTVAARYLILSVLLQCVLVLPWEWIACPSLLVDPGKEQQIRIARGILGDITVRRYYKKINGMTMRYGPPSWGFEAVHGFPFRCSAARWQLLWPGESSLTRETVVSSGRMWVSPVQSSRKPAAVCGQISALFFALNVCILLMILFVPHVLLHQVRKSRRVAKALCIRCGYPVEGPVCSECGGSHESGIKTR